VREWRQRKRDGTTCISFKVCRETADKLVALGWLRAGGTEDEVREALLDLLVYAIEARVRPARMVAVAPLRGPTLGEVWDRRGVG
jgi:hypothetical protein